MQAKKIELVEFLRGYSIFTIVIFHCLQEIKLPPLLSKAIFFGGAGVHLFILLSGLGLYLSFQRKYLDYGAFIKKRLSKIYIPYIIVVLISALIAVFIPVYKNSAYALFGHILFYKMFDKNIIGSYGYPLWFISTIIQFYFIFHLLVKIKTRTSNLWFFVIGLIISNSWNILVIILMKTDDKSWTSCCLLFVWEFMLGMVLADKIQNNTLRVKLNNVYYLIIALFFISLDWLMVTKLGSTGKMFNDIPTLIGYSALAIFLYHIKNDQLNKFLLFTGKISFPLYLVHTLIISIIEYLSQQLAIPISIYSMILAVILSYLVAWLYNYLIMILINRAALA